MRLGLPRQGLLAKSAKDGTLLPVPLLVTPENHLQLDAMQRASRSLWASVRARGAAVTAAFVMSCGLVCVWANGDTFAVNFLGLPSAEERILELLHSLPGGAVAVTVLRLLSEAAISVVRALNPFDGARDALRLDPLSVRAPGPSYLLDYIDGCFIAGVARHAEFVMITPL